MNELQEFSLLQAFLFAANPQLEMRSELEDNDRNLLARIATGDANDSDRDDALALLQANPTALEFLARQLSDN